MKFFVTGATGFLGGHLVRHLVEADHEVVALVRDPARAHELAALGVELCQGDLRDRESMRPGMEGVDGVFHMAAWYFVGEGDRETAEAINVEGTRNVLELAGELEIPRIVYTSTVAIYGDTHGELKKEGDAPDQPAVYIYEDTKRRAHALAEAMAARGLPVIIVMPGVIYGPGDTQGPVAKTIRLWLDGKVPALPARTGYCWAHVDDVVTGHIRAMERGEPGEIYHLAGPPHTLVDVFTLAATVANRRPPPLQLPPFALKATAALLSPFASLLPPAYHPETLRSTAGTTAFGDNRKAREALGFDPRPLAEGFPEYMRWELERHQGADVGS